MLFDVPDKGVENGFVSIETAERMRQNTSAAEFKDRHPAEYQRLLQATIGIKLAHQELTAAKVAAHSLPTGILMADVLDGIEREARKTLQEAADKATAQQLEQVNPDHAAAAPVPAAASKKSRAS